MNDASVLQDIRDRADISDLVIAFYTRAFADERIGPIFTDIVKMDLDAHLPIMCDFWETVLFQAGTYRRDAFSIHRDINDMIPLTTEHFQRWEDLWHETVDTRFAGPKAIAAKIHASRIAGSIQRRLRFSGLSEPIRIGQVAFQKQS
jgi:hemoglobin